MNLWWEHLGPRNRPSELKDSRFISRWGHDCCCEYWLSHAEGFRLCVTSPKRTPLLLVTFQCRSGGIVRTFNRSHDTVLGASYVCNTCTDTLSLESIRRRAAVGIKPQLSGRVDFALDFCQASRTCNIVTAPVIIIILIFNLYRYMTHSHPILNASCTSSPLGFRFLNISGYWVRRV